MKEIIRELKIQREVDFHDNIIRCYGIAKLESENHNNYQLVLEYANGGTLRSYLKENFRSNTAQYNLALMFEGDGITKDIGKAIYWYEKSAEQGDLDAKVKLKTFQDDQ
ncbi:unnamed protein product [Rhizophagus irregularis]|nr:unnamed protein product [Rhizophagus irregularis]